MNTVFPNKKGLRGTIAIPADKSLSHRAVMLLSLAKGKAVIKNFSSAEDPKSTLNLFANLGVDYKYINEKTLEINSCEGLRCADIPLDCGNSGTTMRLASGILCAQNFNSVLTGDESLSKRPMKRIIEPLELMGARITSENGCAPLYIRGGKLHSVNYISKLASAQVKSAVLLAGIQTDGETIFTESYKSRNHTELMLKYLDADIETADNKTVVRKSQLIPKDIEIAGDISSAAFFIAAALIVPNSDIVIKNVGLNPTRTGVIDVVKQMGGNLEIIDMREISGEPVGDLRVCYSPDMKGAEIKGDIIPRLIDEIPVIAVLASQAEGKTVVRDAQDLRNKESDRISALCNELKKTGIEIKELSDGFEIIGKNKISGGCELDSHKDHRLAMSFYVAGLAAEEEINIKDFDCINISLPEFLPLISSLMY
ncbi:3-phosphoshikimate 1-carboxyvinyltransferase [bacterium]|nr:3-phosphoshikimate 1-carboxyvinyltransferase [bacterium]